MALIETNAVHGGTQKRYRFDNGYGASVVSHKYSYGGDRGLWELAVLAFDGEKSSLTYDTPITSDVEGYLTDADVDALLARIEALPTPTP